MKISVMANGTVKVEGATLAEEVEMRKKLQAQGKSCTPIEYEGSAQDCLAWIMGKSENELDDLEDDDDYEDDDYENENEDDGIYVLTDEDEQELEIKLDEVIDYIEDNSYDELSDLNWSKVEGIIENYLWDRPEISENDFYYLEESGQVEKLADRVYEAL